IDRDHKDRRRDGRGGRWGIRVEERGGKAEGPRNSARGCAYGEHREGTDCKHRLRKNARKRAIDPANGPRCHQPSRRIHRIHGGGSSSPQTLLAVSTIVLSFRFSSSMEMRLPATELEKPHCGLSPSRSRGTKRPA